MAQRSFGGRDTVKKLETISDYLAFYTGALSGQRFRLKYLDAFAGTGQIPFASELPLLADLGAANGDLDKFIEGSARRALQIPRPFDEYVFSEIGKNRARDLVTLRGQFPKLADRITILNMDANEAVVHFCTQLQPFDRAVIFLDPFGNQVPWKSLEIIAASERVDLWYLFPAGLGVARQIKNAGSVVAEAEASLDALFGGMDWRNECISFINQPDLLEQNRTIATKIATADGITRYMISRMKAIFKGGVSEKWLPLGSRGVHKFSLLFACANPSAKARELAQRVAKEIMTRN